MICSSRVLPPPTTSLRSRSAFEAQRGPAYANAGYVAHDTITIPAGTLEGFSSGQETYMRKLGAPVLLVRAEIVAERAFELCVEGEPVTAEKSKLLRLFKRQIASCELLLHAYIDERGTFTEVAGITDAMGNEPEGADDDDGADE